MNRACQGCGKPKADMKNYCPECLAKLAAMKEAGYLTPVPNKAAPTTFNDQRGRRNPLHLGSATHEDDYGEESKP